MPTAQVAESTVRRYVAQKKRAIGAGHAGGFRRAVVCVSVKKHKWIGMKPMRISRVTGRKYMSSACGAWLREPGFHCAYLHATQQAFLEAHERAFLWFGGVFQRVRYDNLKVSRKTDSSR